jgi:hypothetical protein
MPKISGGCLCGAVRYECSAEPLGTAICHCTHCQKVSGSAFSVNVVVPAPSLTWQGQSLASYADKGESGKPLSRKFCRNCGSSLATETEALPGAIIIKAGSLDDKSWLKPNYHLWTNSAQPWVRIEPGAKTHFQKVGPERTRAASRASSPCQGECLSISQIESCASHRSELDRLMSAVVKSGHMRCKR